MNVACVATGWYPQSPGGLEKYVFGMAGASARSADALDLFVTGDPGFAAGPARAFSIGRPNDPLWKRMFDARRTFAKEFHGSYDVINLHFAMNALPLIPFIKHRIPRVVHFHGPWAAESRAEGGGAVASAIKAALERFIYHRADRFIVLSTAFKDVLASYGVPPDRISIAPMGVDCDFFVPAEDRQAARRELAWPDDGVPVFFTARRLVNRVGISELLRAARLVRDAGRRISVRIAGKGPLGDALRAQVAALGLTDCVELLGFVSEERLVRCYQAADVTILPTQMLEGFGTIVSESLACGTPVIVTPVGGMPEAVAPLASGLIARSRAPEDIAERMLAVLDGTLALPDREACRRYALERFHWDVAYGRVRSIFAAARC